MSKYKIRSYLGVLVVLLLNSVAQALPAELPADIQWQTNVDDPTWASPKAQRGGRMREFVLSYPLTFRRVGPDSNTSFRAYLNANHIGLVDKHPNTGQWIPAMATHWAIDEKCQAAWFKIDKDARWSDGKPVTADDFTFVLEFMRSKHIVAPWYSNYYTERLVEIKKYDSHTIGIKAAEPKPCDELLEAIAVSPIPRHFHKLDENWVRDYNWKIEPNTGPYKIGALRKGKYIEFDRKTDWWGNNKLYWRHRFNPDHVRIKVIRDPNVAYQYFRKAELDTFDLLRPRWWHKKAQGRIYEQGYVGKIKFYNEVPQPSLGMYLNSDDPLLADINVRKGLAHAMNVNRVIATVLRNDYERLNTMHEGYGDYSNPKLRARLFDLQLANQYFEQAGWLERGNDGIRIKDGERLSLRVTYSQEDHTPRLAVLAEEARKAGVELKLQRLDPAASYKQVLEKKHQVAWSGWGAGGMSPAYWEHFHSDNAHKPQTNNITNVDDPAMDALIIQYREAQEKEERVELAHKLEAMVHEKAVIIPTFKIPYTRAAFWRWMKLPESLGTRTTTDLFDPFANGVSWIDQAEKRRILELKSDGKSLEPLNILNEEWRN